MSVVTDTKASSPSPGRVVGGGPEPEPAVKMRWSLVQSDCPLDLSFPSYQVMGWAR